MGLAYTDFNYEIARGDDRAIVFAVDLESVLQDITGWSVRFTARTAVPEGTVTDDTGATLAYSIGDGVTITDAPNGEVTVAIAGADTYALGAADTTLSCDLQGVDGAGKVATLATGKLVVKGEITRATT